MVLPNVPPVINTTTNLTIPPASITTSSNPDQPDINYLINEAVTHSLPAILAAREISISQSLTRPATGSSANSPITTSSKWHHRIARTVCFSWPLALPPS